MRYLISVLILVLLVSSSAFAAISAKAGLAGGAFRIAGVMDKQLNDKGSIAGEIGYGIGNQYTLVTLGISGKYSLNKNMYAGLMANYSSFSDLVQMSIGPTLTDKAGIGFGAFVGMDIREGLYAQVGYDTRLGGIAEAGYTIKK